MQLGILTKRKKRVNCLKWLGGVGTHGKALFTNVWCGRKVHPPGALNTPRTCSATLTEHTSAFRYSRHGGLFLLFLISV